MQFSVYIKIPLALSLKKMVKQAAILFFLGLLLYLRISLVASLNMSQIDESSLTAIKQHINSNILSKNWSEEAPFCSWIGVICSSASPIVTGLNLSSMGLQGTIAREIGNLSFLTSLDMSNNNISGSIPDEIGNLRGLRVLDMALNRLSGEIPHSLGMLGNLKGLNLSNNYFDGDIPTSLSTCVQLKTLDISHNNLTGNLPTGFGNLSRLEELLLYNNHLTGGLPSTIFNISSLLNIQIGFNQMSGSIPRDICSQSSLKLEHIELHFNQFEGEILPTLTHCHSLNFISLGENKFTGNIPTQFWNSSSLQIISLGSNGFTSTIPPSITNLSNLQVFDAPQNSFYGTIPPEIGLVPSLTRLNLDSNKLNGEVPQSVFNLSKLQILSLSLNNLSGTLPFSIDKGLPNLVCLFLGRNMLHGKIPSSISNLSSLQILELSNNSFNGDIPITLGKLNHLLRLSLEYNQLTNNISKPEQDFLTSLTNCNHLKILSIESNHITGVLPKSLGSGNLSTTLQRFTAHSCRIISPVPNEIRNLSNLQWLDLGYNDLTGGIPRAFWYLMSLRRLDLYGNKFEGPIFDVLCNMKDLYHVDLKGNSLLGRLPMCLGNLSMLREIDFAHNKFSSSIPSTLWANELMEKIDFSNNELEGSLSEEVGNLKRLRELDLSGNQISGELPRAISGLESLIYLSLSNNKLIGPLMNESFASMMDLEHLDLSRNSFSGLIPKSLEALKYLTYFNVSFNELSGEIPNGGPFVDFNAEFFEGNKGLCGAPRFKVEACKSSKSTSSNKSRRLKYILPVVTALVGFAALLVILLRRNRAKKLSPATFFARDQVGVVHERISYNEVLDATCNIDEENLIGKGSFGSVYKGVFSGAMVVAVKVFNLDIQGALKSFDVECKIMYNIRHRNLVKVIAYCSNPNFKALVMEYMSNGNLEKWLYSTRCSLNIFQRLEIMIDVASAVEYLHQGLTFPIAHCDLKPNNILLDEDMVAHVGDFGIAKLFTREQRIQQTRTLGTVGYMAPEYGSDGLISTAVDVYSYGILLMEIFSGRKPTDEMFSGELTMTKWVSESFPTWVMKIVDDELLNMIDEFSRARYESCLALVIKLALDCTMYLPEDRPIMKDVLARIEMIKLNLTNDKSKNEKGKY